jgi:hypothetical protein
MKPTLEHKRMKTPISNNNLINETPLDIEQNAGSTKLRAL